MACGKVSFIYTLFTCEGVEEKAFTGKDTVKHYVWWGKTELEIESNAKTF